MKRRPITESEMNDVFNAIEDYIHENHKLCSIEEITKLTSLSRKRCDEILKRLVNEDKLYVVYEGKGKPRIYIPRYMFEEILRSQRKPRWIKEYRFSDKEKLLKELEGVKEKLFHYETLERLLYGTGEPLEEAVEYALKYLRFEKVHRPKETDTYDVSFEYKGTKYILEVEGTTRQGSKDKVDQLDGWIKKEIMEKGYDPDKLVGVFVVNHYRNEDPKNRGYPLTDQAKLFLKYRHFRFFTTTFLFNIVKEVEEKSLDPEKAREKIIVGEKYV